MAGADSTLFDLFPKVQVFVEEPAMIRNQLDRWWNKVEQRHERSGIGSLITADRHLPVGPMNCWRKSPSRLGWRWISWAPWTCWMRTSTPGRDRFLVPSDAAIPRFDSSVSAADQDAGEQETRMVLVAPNHGEVERLARLAARVWPDPYRLGSRTQPPGGEQCYDESSHLAGDFRTPVIVRSAISSGVSLPDCNLVVFGANDLI